MAIVLGKEPMERMLELANAFFEEYGLVEKVESFIDSEDVKSIVEKGYENLIKQVADFKIVVMDEVKEVSDEIYQFLIEHEENIFKDAIQNLQIRIFASFEFLSEDVAKQMMKSGLLEKNFDENKHKYMNSLEVIVNGIVDFHIDRYVKKVSSSYVKQFMKENLPKEIADRIDELSDEDVIVIVDEIGCKDEEGNDTDTTEQS